MADGEEIVIDESVDSVEAAKNVHVHKIDGKSIGEYTKVSVTGGHRLKLTFDERSHLLSLNLLGRTGCQCGSHKVYECHAIGHLT